MDELLLSPSQGPGSGARLAGALKGLGPHGSGFEFQLPDWFRARESCCYACSSAWSWSTLQGHFHCPRPGVMHPSLRQLKHALRCQTDGSMLVSARTLIPRLFWGLRVRALIVLLGFKGSGPLNISGWCPDYTLKTFCLPPSFSDTGNGCAACALQGAVIIGHSTGCQDAMRYVSRHKAAAGAAQLLGVILQAPVNSFTLLTRDQALLCIGSVY